MIAGQHFNRIKLESNSLNFWDRIYVVSNRIKYFNY